MKFYYTFFLIFFLGFLGQSQTLYSVLEKKTIALGETNTYKIRIENLGGKVVTIAPKNELLPFHFEEIYDSIDVQGDYYERIIEFAVFEEGNFKIPAFDVKIGDEISKTIPYEVEVINTAQKGDEINDLMDNKEVPMDLLSYWDIYKLYILGTLAILLLIILIWLLVKYSKRRSLSPKVNSNKTLKALSQLRKKKYIENSMYRNFYIELVEITRGFLVSNYRLPADVLLTDDLLDTIKVHQTVSTENEKILFQVLTRGDLVKFSKAFPTKQTMEKDFDDIVKLVKQSSKDLEFEKLRKDV